MKIKIGWQHFVELLNIKFHEYLPSDSRVPCV